MGNVVIAGIPDATAAFLGDDLGCIACVIAEAYTQPMLSEQMQKAAGLLVSACLDSLDVILDQAVFY